MPLSTPACSSLQSSGNNVVCTGWLGKLTPEKMLRQYAWKKRWFILRNGKMNGEPDVLEYYKNEHSKKPLRIINLNFCMQLDVVLTFNKKEPQRSFMFDIITNECTFYLMTETETDMNRWVQSICQICGFSQTKESTDTLRNLSSVNHSLCSSPAEFSSSSQHLLQTRRSSALSHSSQPTVSSHIQPALSTSTPQEYQHLHQCISQRTENARSATFSQSTRQESDTATQNLAQGNRHCISRVSGQVHGFYSLPKPSRQVKDHAFDIPRSHLKGSLTVSEADNEDVYTFKEASCKHIHRKLNTVLSRSVKNCVGILMGIALNL
ncbi:GRB2-associated-binding protein 2 [Cricetulus griseus]|uniref:GRB2-associated-binding protein 2 n=1 Tax=Cricetulus griseus TaxID=10029 RepID=A0A061HVF6_CRIGR|nr:GRB2-associated-binding protein 2 [Cricetulus griseus]